VSQSDLGVFIRRKREATAPVDVGLTAGPRRRTPGLRRAELAMLAGISVEYLTRIEQGRDRNPSPQVMGALADALLLNHDERRHLLFAAKVSSGASTVLCSAATDSPACPATEPPTREVRPTVRAVLERLEPAPAVLCNQTGDILAHTVAYDLLARPLGVLDGEHPNLLRYLFTDPRARQVYPDWERVADEQLRILQYALPAGNVHLQAVVDELTVLGGVAFTSRMALVPSPPDATGVEHIEHPEAGDLRLRYETLQLDGPRIVVYLPADDTARAALDRLIGMRPGTLRSVTA
jgi:transcriptional regulator with XRE-family HTH domain